MEEDFQMGNGNWRETSRNGFDGGTTPATSTTTTLASFPPAAAGGSLVFHGGDQSSTGRALANQMVGLGLSSETMDWNQALLPGEKSKTTFHSMLEVEEDISSTDFHPDLSLELLHFSQASSNDSTLTSQNFSTGFMRLLMSEKTHQSQENQPMLNNYPYPILSTGYGVASSSHLQPFWSAPFSCFHEKPKNMLGKTDVTSKDQNPTNKRSRGETPLPLPAIKVRKEKMGDRITALQQLVSPFGKTDTASVLSESIEYIKFLHKQISALSCPYMKHGADPMQHQQISSKKKLDREGPRQDLRDRGLCLIPVSITFPETHETTADFWTPTFVGSFR